MSNCIDSVKLVFINLLRKRRGLRPLDKSDLSALRRLGSPDETGIFHDRVGRERHDREQRLRVGEDR